MNRDMVVGFVDGLLPGVCCKWKETTTRNGKTAAFYIYVGTTPFFLPIPLLAKITLISLC